MTLAGRIVSLFPTAMFAATIGALGLFAAAPSIATAALLLAIVYLAPVLAFRLHEVWRPLRVGVTRLDAPTYSPWWASHCFQLYYECLPFLESILRAIPGCYSAWLRLWGARIGKGVYWTPRIELTDRSLLDIGDGVVFGHKVECYCHVIRQRGESLRLIVSGIVVGAGAFLGAGSRLGPGACIPAGAFVPVLTDVGVNQTYRAAQGHRSAEQAI